MLAEMSGNRIAWILLEIKNIFLMIRNDHDLILIIVFVFYINKCFIDLIY